MIYSFLEIPNFVVNTGTTVNSIGELSDFTHTFAKDIKKFNTDNVILNAFGWDTLTTDQTINFQIAMVAIAEAMDSIPNYAVTQGNSFLVNIKNALPPEVTNVSLGAAILNPKDNKNYPAWIKFDIVINNIPWTHKIWLNNTSFKDFYPLGNIEFVFPIASLQKLYTAWDECNTIVNRLTPTSLISKAAIQVNGAITGYDSFTLQVYDRLDQSKTFDFPITVAYNGGKVFCNQANYLEKFKQILLNSGTHTLSEWLVVIPRLIPLIKYFIAPLWDNPAIVSPAIVSPICSPTIPPFSIGIVQSILFPDLSLVQVSPYLNYSVAIYKSIGFYVLPAITNLDGRISWRNKFSDYFLVSPVDLNIAQMSPPTQNVTSLLDELLRVAEEYKTGDLLPSGYGVENRANYIYLYKSIDNILLSVLTRESFLA